jgi:proteic killer suppression protein
LFAWKKTIGPDDPLEVNTGLAPLFPCALGSIPRKTLVCGRPSPPPSLKMSKFRGSAIALQASLKYKNVERTALIWLRFQNAATSLSDLRLPGLHLEPLKGDRKGQYSIRINDRYRICFEWRDGDAYSVEIVDYH